jgi:branched-chain amino acid transport system permease protein
MILLALPMSASADEVGTEYEFSIGGNVQLDGEPLAGVKMTVSGNGYAASTVTDDEGRWLVGVPEKAAYEVTLDENTLPEGIAVVDEGGPVKQVEIKLSDSAFTNFFIGEGERNTVSLPAQFFSRFIYGINFGLILALASIGLSLVFGTTRLSNFAHAEMITFGALAALFFSAGLGLPILIAIPLAVVASGLAGLGMDASIWRPLRRRGVGIVQLMIVSIGLALSLRYLFQFFIGGGTIQLEGAQSESFKLFGTLTLSVNDFLSMGISIVVLILVAIWLIYSKTGKATRAISDNSDLAAASGIDVDRVVRLVWILASALAGLGGILWAYFRPGIKWDMGEKILLLMFAAVVLGGLGTAFGALIGALIVGVMVETSALLIPADLKYVGALVVLIAVLLVKPTGLLGRKERIG